MKKLFARIGPHNASVIALLLVALGYSLLGVAARLLENGFEPMTQVYVRVFIGFLLSMVIFRKELRFKIMSAIPRTDWFWLLMMGIFGYALSVYFITRAALTTTLINTAVIFALLPFVVYFYSFFLLKEKVRLVLIGLLIIALVGVSLIATKQVIPNLSVTGEGEVFALLSVLCAGFWSIGRKKLSPTLNNSEITMIVMFVAAASGCIIAFGRGEEFSFSAFAMGPVILGLFMGSVLNVVLTFFENFAFGTIDLVLGNQILMTENVFALVFGYFFYAEIISATELVGALLILSTVFIANRILPKES